MSTPSIKKLAFSTTNDKATSFGLLVSRIPLCLSILAYKVHLANVSGYLLFADALCIVLVLIGLFTRPAALLLCLNILVFNQSLFWVRNDPIHPWPEMMVLYTAFYALMFFAGPGRYSLDTVFLDRSEQA